MCGTGLLTQGEQRGQCLSCAPVPRMTLWKPETGREHGMQEEGLHGVSVNVPEHVSR